jgi:hypothetical protein
VSIGKKRFFLEKLFWVFNFEKKSMAVANILGQGRRGKENIPDIPNSLIYEVMDGQPIYYKGYKDVLDGTKNQAEIMGISGLQGIIISYLVELIFSKIGSKQYRILFNEIGVHINHNQNLASDIGIYDRKLVTPEKINTRYIDVPAKVFLEVDIKADVEDLGETGYIRNKTQQLLEFGAEKVIWVLTKPKVVITATPDGKWAFSEWDFDVEILDGHAFNIGHYLNEEGINTEIH